MKNYEIRFMYESPEPGHFPKKTKNIITADNIIEAIDVFSEMYYDFIVL
jgi:hypothetical protein